MAVALICPEQDRKSWVKALTQADPDLDLRIWPDTGSKEDIEMVLAWSHPQGVWENFSGLKCICSLGAGVDHLMADPTLPKGVPVVRLQDKSLIHDMTEYLCVHVLFYYRQMDAYQKAQAQNLWQPLPAGIKSEWPVGIMGLGQLGLDAARKIKDLGFPVVGWKNSTDRIPGIEVYAGPDQLKAFLARTRILICLLPLTPATCRILNRSLFSGLPKGAVLINVARGSHLNEADLLDALDCGQLSGACLDVFETEPLPHDHPFWNHPAIRITPHVSSLSRPRDVVPQILENLGRLRQGLELNNQVCVEKGY